MFPSFDKLTDADFAENARLLAKDRFLDPNAAVEALVRLRTAYLPHERRQSTNRTVPMWYKTLRRVLAEAPLPETVLNAVDRYVHVCSEPTFAFDLFEQTPRSLEMLARLACGSPFLTQFVLSQPKTLRNLTKDRRTADVKSREGFIEEAFDAIKGFDSFEQKLEELRRYQRREILRIGICDAFGLLDLRFVTLQLSLLADAMVHSCLTLVCEQLEVTSAPFSVLALGKHGGEELNYSSDIDLVLVANEADATSQRVARRLINALSKNLATGFLYRVDMRLRPWGEAGPLVTTVESYDAYLKSDAKLWEKQALLKVRVVAGDAVTGTELLARLPSLLFTESEQSILDNVLQMKEAIENQLHRTGKLDMEVKLGAGSIRDIEFLTQSLQLIHGHREPRTASANTLDALIRLTDFGFLEVTKYRQLRDGYIFFRTIEHALQLLHNQQTHLLPSDIDQREWLARRLDFQSEKHLLERFREHQQAVRRIFELHFSTSVNADDSPTSGEFLPLTENPAGEGLQTTLATMQTELKQLTDEASRNYECRVYCAESPTDTESLFIAVCCPNAPAILPTVFGVFLTNRIDIREGTANTGSNPGGPWRTGQADMFLGTFLAPRPSPELDEKLAERLRVQLNELTTLRNSEGDQALQSQLVRTFCERVATLHESGRAVADLTVHVSNTDDESATRLDISGDDSFGFFFELSNALAICGFHIQRAELGESGGRICDVLVVTEGNGERVDSPERIEELRTAITLIKQFTNWLPSNTDPHNALLRFRDLLQRLLRGSEWESSAATLRQPKVLRAIGRVLGISRYLWEDFLLVQPDELLPLLSTAEELRNRIPRDILLQECRQRMVIEGSAAGLNAFKDYHLFRIDLRHVLGHCGPFGAFAEEVSELADVVLSRACNAAFSELASIHGVPMLADGAECSFALAALGKFGGREMGFASDVELLLVYEEDGRTDGAKKLSATSFFERLVSRIQEMIRSRRKGIFEIDLRMRPYGKAGPLAVSLVALKEYFEKDGDAWPFERQALVKFRCVSGTKCFFDTVETAVRAIVYLPQVFDFDAMRGLREKQVQQLVRAGTVNAKLSDGGLVDCEYAVQATQLTFGHQTPQLQTTNTLTALAACAQAGLISEQELNDISRAYRSLRELIDCLRMSRGNAEDLTIPQAGSADFADLSRRLQAVHGSAQSLVEIEKQMETVRAFSTRVEKTCRRRNGLPRHDSGSRR